MNRSLHLSTGTMIVAASMVGTGVFTTTGFLLRDLGSSFTVLLSWAGGGLLALLGALAYAELGAALPANGGEYQLLSRIYHPAVGFVAGWVSLIVGFSAPLAASAVAFGEYLGRVEPSLPPTASALALVVGTAALHALRVRWGSLVQNATTLLDVLLIMVLIGGGLVAIGDRLVAPRPDELESVLSAEFAIGLIYVSFAYSGYNATIYVAGELKEPARTLPRALIVGTTVVTCVYIGVNYVFLMSAPPSELSGVVEVGHVAARHLFGEGPAKLVSALVALGLFTTVSALMMTGPRVYESMARDHSRLAKLAGGDRAEGRGPTPAIVLQAGVAILMVVTASFEALLAYMGFVLALSTTLTIAGVFVLRHREPDLPRPYRTWAHPLSTCAALLLNAWILLHAVWQRPLESAVGLATIGLGYVLYGVVRVSCDRPSGAS